MCFGCRCAKVGCKLAAVRCAAAPEARLGWPRVKERMDFRILGPSGSFRRGPANRDRGSPAERAPRRFGPAPERARLAGQADRRALGREHLPGNSSLERRSRGWQRLGARRQRQDHLPNRPADARSPSPYFSAPYAAQATEILLEAIARPDGTRSSVTRELLRTRVEDGILGDTRFDENGDLVEGPVTIFRIVGKGDVNTQDGFEGANVDRVITARADLLR